MLLVRACQTVLLTAALVAAPAAFAGRSHRAATSGHSKKKVKVHAVIGQRGIDSDRAREIQTALIRQNYLTGEPTGQWDDQTEAAMQKFQSDNGWQTKLTPDSRALIKLGLGPDHASSLPATTASKPATAPAPAASVPATAEPESASNNTLAAAHSISN